ncbi:hypothetical protein VL10_18575 [Leclercia adecarboxylata]|nr:hypothetical protein VL10_18575 [Leclercia adecarboxylata]KMN63278.1 hypothetical protein VK95_19645 [Leclercia sp. LK8]
MNYVYSSKNDAFYPLELKDLYVAAKTWPVDGIEVEESCFIEFTSTPPEGKVRAGGDDGLPEWKDIPPPSHEDLVAVAEKQKTALLAEATQAISFWQTELQLGIISDEDKASLIAWMKYIKAVQAVDTSKVPNITWPTPPDENS